MICLWNFFFLLSGSDMKLLPWSVVGCFLFILLMSFCFVLLFTEFVQMMTAKWSSPTLLLASLEDKKKSVTCFTYLLQKSYCFCIENITECWKMKKSVHVKINTNLKKHYLHVLVSGPVPKDELDISNNRNNTCKQNRQQLKKALGDLLIGSSC